MKSFVVKTKDALTREDTGQPQRRCCRLAELTGLLLTCGAVTLVGGEGLCLTLRTEHPGVARRAVRLLRAEFSASPAIRIVRASRLGGRTAFEIRLDGQESARAMGACSVSPLERNIPRHCMLRKCCRGAFLRGAFLGCGTLMAPERGYLLEFVLADERTAQSLARFLQAFYALRAGVNARKGSWVVYLKGGEAILSVLSLIGANAAILEMENVRILRQARNEANRAANCDAANIAKMLGAADRHMQAIALLERTLGLDALPDTLREIAVERKLHPDASLEALGQMLEPPVGKSGVYHRLRRLEALARSIAKKEEESL